ncbi:hypothetical protein MMC17_004987 [Xylographa soralifera]|nr:hypothetical protein [Xylographa soralifera]
MSEKELVDSLTSVKKTSKYHDLVIRCQDREWKAHRIVICLRSKFFEKACDGSFKEGRSGEITLAEDDAEVVDRMIDYLYRLDYDDKPNTANANSSDGPLVMNANIYAIADKYEIWSLKEVAQRKTAEALMTDSNHESFLSAVDIVWNTTPLFDRGLRNLFLPVIAENKKTLLKKEAFMESVRTNGDLAADVLEDTWAKSSKLPSRLYCSYANCRRLQNVMCCGCLQSVYLSMEEKAQNTQETDQDLEIKDL